MKFIKLLKAKKIKADENLNKQQIFAEVRENLNNGEADDGIEFGLNHGILQIPDFIYRDDAFCIDVKFRGNPKVDRDLNDKETELLNDAFNFNRDYFIKDLEDKYGEVIVTGRSGGYIGLKVGNNRINNFVIAEIDDSALEELFDRALNYIRDMQEQYDIEYLEGDVANEIIGYINDDPKEYLTLKPTQKLLQFKNEIEDTAKQWENMNFEQFTEGWN